jgi:hypothetical protein
MVNDANAPHQTVSPSATMAKDFLCIIFIYVRFRR